MTALSGQVASYTAPLLPQRAMVHSSEGAMQPDEAMEDTGPVASTSKEPYETMQSFKAAPRSPSPSHSDSHAHDQDINPSSMQDSTLQRARASSMGRTTLSTSVLKGKERASPQSASTLPSLTKQHSPPRAIVLPDPFQKSEMERLQVENDMLKKQFDILARKRNGHRSLDLANLSTRQDNAQRSAGTSGFQLQELDRMLRTSEAQRKRLERELRYLRSYLLSSIEPYRLPTPESESEEEEEVRERSDSIEGGRGTALQEGNAASTRRHVRKGSHDRSISPKRKIPMGDAETEHLLLASTRMRRVRKIVDLHPESELSHSPRARRIRLTSTGPSTSFPSLRNGNEQTMDSQSQPLSYPWTSNTQPDLPSSSVSPTRPLIPLPGVLGSPIRTTRVKLEAESPQVNFSNAASIFRSSAAADPSTSDDVRAPTMQPSTSATSSGKGGNGERKIGRPLGSPNKTKLVSINSTAAVRRRVKASEFATSNGGRGRGRGRPFAAASSSSVHPYSGGRTARGGSEAQDPPASVDELLLAAQSLYGNNEDDEMDVDQEGEEDWSQDIREEIDEDDFSPPREAKHHASTSSRAVPYPPATPASLDGPDMTRFPNTIYSTSVPGLPETPGRPRIVEQKGKNSYQTLPIPPMTPNTIARNERSALDVLAEEAASASKGPSTAHSSSRNLESLSGSARNLAQEMEMARRSPGSAAIANGFQMASQQPRPRTEHTSTANNRPHYLHSLGEAFVPDQQGVTFDAANATHEEGMPIPMTIAEQLAQGVDVSHPLIDPEDLQAGMTPAAALAKKSRSPYIKWTLEEDEQLVKGVAEHGTKWEAVARMIPSRSYHQCRQRWLRGLKSGDALPPSMQHLKPQIDAAVQAYEQARPGGAKKVEP